LRRKSASFIGFWLRDIDFNKLISSVGCIFQKPESSIP
jgi:hypothetical protein